MYEFPLFSQEKSSTSDVVTVIIQENKLFIPSDNVYRKAETYKSVAGKIAKELFVEKERKLAIQEELDLFVEEKDDLNAELDSSLSKVERQKKSCEKVGQ